MITTPPLDRLHTERLHAPRWLRDVLRAEVMHGTFADGTLPAEADLMLRYGAPRVAVRGALDLLRREGLIERRPGIGSHTVAGRYTYRLVELHGAVRPAPHRLSNVVVCREAMPMSPAIAQQLDEQPGSPCLCYEYVGYSDGEPVGIYTNYLRYPEAEAVAAVPFAADWYTLLDTAGVEVGETALDIEAVVADQELAELLQTPVGQPIVALRQVIFDPTGRPYDFAILRHRADRISILSQAVDRSGKTVR